MTKSPCCKHLGLCLWIAFLTGAGCSPSSSPSPAQVSNGEVETGIQESAVVPQPATGNSSTNYDAEIRSMAQLMQDLVPAHLQVPNNAGEQRALMRTSQTALEKIEAIEAKLNRAQPLTKEHAQRLMETAIPELSAAATKCYEVSIRPFDSSRINSLSPGNLVSAVASAQRVRTKIEAVINPPEDETVDQSAPSSNDGASEGIASSAPDVSEATASPGTMSSTNPFRSKAPAEVKWQSAIDPAQGDSLLEADTKINITIPGMPKAQLPADAHAAQTLQFRNEQALRAGLVYSWPTGPFVRVGANAQAEQTSEIWNYATGRKVGTIRRLALALSKVMALSPDGAYFAAQPFHQSLIGIWDVKAAKPLGTVPVQDWSGVKFLAFGAENRLIIYDSSQLKVFALPSLQLLHQLPVAGNFTHQAPATMTPGGRFIAVHEYEGFETWIGFYDVVEGKLTGKIPIDRNINRIQALAISPDSQFFYAMTANVDGAVHRYNLQTGSVLDSTKVQWSVRDVHHLTSKIHDMPGAMRMSVFPDGRRLLVAGLYVVDATNGEVVQKLPEDVAYWVQIVGENRLVVVNGAKLVDWELP